MARYNAEDKARSREKIIGAAGRLFKEKGYLGAGVDAIMSKAGLTAGAFYAHFDSKAELLVESLLASVQSSRSFLLKDLDGLSDMAWHSAIVKRYLSKGHRQSVTEGCPFPALVSELPRTSKKARALFDKYIETMVGNWQKRIPKSGNVTPHERALATFCLMVGGMAVARAVASEALSEKILAACRKLALEGLDHESTETR